MIIDNALDVDAHDHETRLRIRNLVCDYAERIAAITPNITKNESVLKSETVARQEKREVTVKDMMDQVDKCGMLAVQYEDNSEYIDACDEYDKCNTLLDKIIAFSCT